MPWRSCDPADTKELSERLHNAATVTIKRLRAEFPSDDVRAHLSCFDCKGDLQHNKKPRGDPLRTQVLMHVKALVQLLKLDLGRAILEYRDAAQPVLALVAEGQPLAAASNPAVWSRVLEPTFVCTGRVAPLVFLPVMIRFYISIEDGECTVERHLGSVRDCLLRFKSDNVPLLDDAVVAADGMPTSKDELVDPATGELTDTSRFWTTKWRACHGARLGCIPRKCIAGAREKFRKLFTFKKFKNGVMKAAAGAVIQEQVVGGACGSTGTDFGVKLSDVRRIDTSNAGTPASQFWTKGFQRFADVTRRRNIQGQFLKNYKFRSIQGAGKPTPLKGISKFCWLEPPPAEAPKGVNVKLESGEKKCFHADLVVTDNIFKLSDGQTLSADVQLVIDLIHIIALAKPVITATSWRVANGKPSDVPATDIMRHPAPAAHQPICHLNYTRAFKNSYPGVVGALNRAAKVQNSRWRSIQTATGFKSLSDLVARLLEIRRVVNVMGTKSWTEKGPTAV